MLVAASPGFDCNCNLFVGDGSDEDLVGVGDGDHLGHGSGNDNYGGDGNDLHDDHDSDKNGDGDDDGDGGEGDGEGNGDDDCGDDRCGDDGDYQHVSQLSGNEQSTRKHHTAPQATCLQYLSIWNIFWQLLSSGNNIWNNHHYFGKHNRDHSIEKVVFRLIEINCPQFRCL